MYIELLCNYYAFLSYMIYIDILHIYLYSYIYFCAGRI